MKRDVKDYVNSRNMCQRTRVKYLQRADRTTLPVDSSVPFEVIHHDFAELKKKSEGVRKTQAFLLAIGEYTQMVNTRPGREDATSVIAMFERDIFRNTEVVICDNGPGFSSKPKRTWTQQRNIQLKFTAPCHPAANSMAKRAIGDIK